jgi:hypothetical protein
MAFQLAGMALQPVIDIVLDKSGLGRGFDRLLNPNKYEEIRKQRKENNILEKQAQQQEKKELSDYWTEIKASEPVIKGGFKSRF